MRIQNALTRLKDFDSQHGTNFADVDINKNTANVRCLNNFDETAVCMADRLVANRRCWLDVPGKIITFDAIANPRLHDKRDFQIELK
jgi:hypothetical protein